ncbi:MAG: Rrf2 family transcriptional regulator [Clostridia bacterium]|nr:Rrf2 family transcriptional regulator [Clostridia bacterium]
MHMTLEADYAVRIVEFLAVQDARTDAKTISEQTSVTPRFTLKILRTLVASGIVVSYKGAKGGYVLAKPAKEITLRQVIEAVEGPYMISRCQGESYNCTRTDCHLHSIYGKISAMVRRELDSYTFDTICAFESSEETTTE